MKRSCPTISEESLWSLVDTAYSDVDPGLLEHAESCVACRSRLAEIRQLHEGLEAIGRAEEPPLPEHIGPYRILRLIGKGGMGIVYEAEQSSPARRVALKVMRPLTSPNERRLRAFRREIQALGRLNHACIATVFDAGATDDGQLYLVMELVDGDRLDRWCEDAEDALSVERRTRLAARIAEAVHHAHERGVIHRDLKPANVFVDAEDMPHLLDFGLARFLDPEQDVTLTRSFHGSAPSGTLPYMSPEQLAGDQEDQDARTDVYSLGVILYRLLTGRLPYEQATSAPQALRNLSDETPLHPTRHDSRVPKELGDVVMKALAKERERRYPTAGSLAGDLRRFLAGEAVHARPPSYGYKLRVFARRHRALCAAALLLVASTMLLATLWPDGTVRASRPTTLLTIPEYPGALSYFTREFDVASDAPMIVHRSKPVGEILLWDPAKAVSEVIAPRREGWTYHLPRWSPDTRKVAFLGYRSAPDLPSGRQWGVFVLERGSGNVARLGPVIERSEQQLIDFCWTPDGSAITYATPGGDLATLSLDGETTRWTTGAARGARSIGGYSPDGRWIVLAAQSDPEGPDTERDVWLMRAGGGRGIQLTFDPGFEGDPVWSPSGEAIWFVSDRSAHGALNLWKLDVDRHTGRPEAPPEQVTFHANGRVRGPSFTNGGRDLLYSLTQGDGEIWTSAGERFEDAYVVAQGGDPVLAPDGETIYFSGPPERPGLYAIPRAGGAPRRLAQAGLPAGHLFDAGFDVSPDGTHLAQAVESGGKYAIQVIPTAGGAPRVLDVLDARPSAPRWSADSQSIAYAVTGGLYAAPRDGGAPRRLAQIWKWESLEWSPSGDAIAGLGYRTPADETDATDRIAALLVAYPQGHLTQVTQEANYKEGLHWHPSGEFLTYMLYGPGPVRAQIRKAYPDARPTELVIEQADHWDYIGLWAPSGRRFAFHSYSDGCSAVHYYDQEKNAVEHDLLPEAVGLPRWSAGGEAAAWVQRRPRITHFEIIHGVR